MSLQEAVQLLRGKAGDSVTLAVLHEGEAKPTEMKMVREIIHVNSVLGDKRNADGSWNFFLADHDRIGYVRISSFTDATAGELDAPWIGCPSTTCGAWCSTCATIRADTSMPPSTSAICSSTPV